MSKALSAPDRKLLAALEQGPAGSVAELRKRAGLSGGSIAQNILRLRWRGLVAWDRLALNGVQTDLSRDHAPKAQSSAEAVEKLCTSGSKVGTPKRTTASLDDQQNLQPSVASGPPQPFAIGDVVPLPADFDRERWAQQRRRLAAERAMRPANSIRAVLRANLQKQADAETRRQNCPIEQAKTTLRRHGMTVYSAAVIDPKAKGYVVGTRRLTEAELLAEAARRGQQSSAAPRSLRPD